MPQNELVRRFYRYDYLVVKFLALGLGGFLVLANPTVEDLERIHAKHLRGALSLAYDLPRTAQSRNRAAMTCRLAVD